jgi:hypothetical protein
MKTIRLKFPLDAIPNSVQSGMQGQRVSGRRKSTLSPYRLAYRQSAILLCATRAGAMLYLCRSISVLDREIGVSAIYFILIPS